MPGSGLTVKLVPIKAVVAATAAEAAMRLSMRMGYKAKTNVPTVKLPSPSLGRQGENCL